MGYYIMKKYFNELKSIKNRFPMHEGEQCAVKFSWVNLFDDMTYSSNDVRFEETCILYNIGILLMGLGSQDNRRTDSVSIRDQTLS